MCVCLSLFSIASFIWIVERKSKALSGCKNNIQKANVYILHPLYMCCNHFFTLLEGVEEAKLVRGSRSIVNVVEAL